MSMFPTDEEILESLKEDNASLRKQLETYKSMVKFSLSVDPQMARRWEVFMATPEELIGKKVQAISSGFTCSAGQRQIMVIDDANHTMIHFMPCEESINAYEGHKGWACKYEERYNKFIFYTDEKINQ